MFSCLPKAFLYVWLAVSACFAHAAVKPIWQIGVDVRASDRVVAAHGGLNLFRAKVEQQFRDIDREFNRSDAFKGEFRFIVNTLESFSNSASEVISQPIPSAHFRLVYDDQTSNAWWYENWRTILFGWLAIDNTGPFTLRSTAALVHEFGHTRGAVDLYGLEVGASRNPVSLAAYRGPVSWMDDPYDRPVWDEHSVHIINGAAARIDLSPRLTQTAFPERLAIRAINRDGSGIPNASVRLYPIAWNSGAVAAEPAFTGTTDASASWFMTTADVFGTGTSGGLWGVRTPNYVVHLEANGQKGYAWLPFTDAQNAWFRSGSADYVLDVILPAETFAGWADASITNTTAGRDFYGDPDGDGVYNALEYAFSTNPSARTTEPRTEVRNGVPIISMPAPRNYMAEVHVVYETAQALTGPWIPAMTRLRTDATGKLRLELAGPDPDAAPTHFFRVRAFEEF